MTGRWLRRAVLFLTPLATALIIFQHPPDPTTAHDLGPATEQYILIHVGLLFVLPLLGMSVWLLLEGITGAVALVSRVLLPIALVFYAAFDSLVGIGAGVLAREALLLDGAESVGAEALAARWMEIPGPIPIIGALGPLSWSFALLLAAAAHWRAGSSLIVVLGLALAGPLFGFGHAFITGPIAMAGLLAAALTIEFGGGRPAPRGQAASDP